MFWNTYCIALAANTSPFPLEINSSQTEASYHNQGKAQKVKMGFILSHTKVSTQKIDTFLSAKRTETRRRFCGIKGLS
jgi:Rps23 Pro-64 3,4-dihydroxylase Tpa1-like proline 4-hydroxylase